MIRNLRVAVGSRLISWGWRITPSDLTGRIDFAVKGEEPHDFPTDRFEDEAPSPVAHVARPDCGEEVPIHLSPVRLDLDDDGQQVAAADLQMDDVWAHAWTHGTDGPA